DPFRERPHPEPELLTVPGPTVPRYPSDRSNPARPTGPSFAGRRGDPAHRGRPGDRERDLRCHGETPALATVDPGRDRALRHRPPAQRVRAPRPDALRT